MNTQVICSNLDLGNFGKNLEILRAAKNLLVIYYKLPVALLQHSAFLKKSRFIFEHSEEPCLEHQASQVYFIRNTLAEILDGANKTFFLAPFRIFLRWALEEWDDLAEDCAVATDPEIKNLMRKIADAL